MKKRNRTILTAAVILAVVLLIGGGLLIYANQNSLGTSEGLYLKADNGSHLLIDGSSPIQMSDAKGRNLFEGLTDGDRIRVKHDGILETYPGRTGAYKITKLADGDRSDIPQDVMDALTELGWLTAPLDPESPANLAADEVFDARLSYVGWAEEKDVWGAAINYYEYLQGTENALPLMLINHSLDLDSLKNGFEGTLNMNGTYGEVGSFADATGAYDDEFFAENSLFVVYVEAASGSYRFDLDYVYCDGETFQISVKQTNDPETHTDDMAGWFLTVPVPKTMIATCTYLKAFMA